MQTIADYLALDGQSTYRIIAYEKAAALFRDHPVSVADMALQGELRQLPGVGDAIETKVLEYVATGDIAFLARLRERLSRGTAAGDAASRDGAQEDALRVGERRSGRHPRSGEGRRRRAATRAARHGREDRGQHPAGHRDLDRRGGGPGSGPPPARGGGTAGRPAGGGVARAAPGGHGRLRRQPAPLPGDGARHRSGGRFHRPGARDGRVRLPARARPGGGPGRDQAGRRHVHGPWRRPADRSSERHTATCCSTSPAVPTTMWRCAATRSAEASRSASTMSSISNRAASSLAPPRPRCTAWWG